MSRKLRLLTGRRVAGEVKRAGGGESLMETVKQFETVGERGYFRPRGAISLDHVVALIDAALGVACARGLREVVVNVTGLSGVAAPDIVTRYEFVRQWAQTVRGRVRLAVVAGPELIDREKFGVTVAANRGLQAEVFLSEDEAVAWLARKPTAQE
jgi:hypothetical protein